MNAMPSDPVPQPGARRPVAVWPWPIALGVLTLFGLLSALLGQHGVWLALSWGALSIPIVVTGFYVARAFFLLPISRHFPTAERPE
ncbi:hypothetical protein [Brytella acorum]|uniref:hypothetical protein n=1 Tax=Brytella acorum TaxID=2959299 RepID=UPI0025AE504C|nr:hypothetical protein [Brytella acorum]MDF3625959.1 hypothetical protein [Brytella acorum]